ncbi:hypothetical protein ACP179_01420 (plasmid) [Xenorhabdus stockiae]|uniref:hypothetical protein n=1 Tax=Xenorhabdus stockiae TaxID=351614 RepID=UPI003CE749DC
MNKTCIKLSVLILAVSFMNKSIANQSPYSYICYDATGIAILKDRSSGIEVIGPAMIDDDVVYCDKDKNFKLKNDIFQKMN